MDDKINLKQCQVMNLKPNDVIIYKSDCKKSELSDFSRAEIISRLRVAFPKNKCVVLFNGDDIKISRNTKV
jgi:hypothetical protein